MSRIQLPEGGIKVMSKEWAAIFLIDLGSAIPAVIPVPSLFRTVLSSGFECPADHASVRHGVHLGKYAGFNRDATGCFAMPFGLALVGVALAPAWISPDMGHDRFEE